MNIYISSSWKNRKEVRQLAKLLEQTGHSVYDFTNPECRQYPELPPEEIAEIFNQSKQSYRDFLVENQGWRCTVVENYKAIRNCDLMILLLPCGNDSHADWGVALGMDKPNVILGYPPQGQYSLVHYWADAILETQEALLNYLEAWRGA